LPEDDPVGSNMRVIKIKKKTVALKMAKNRHE
jgi:hypothetical protein